MSSLTADVRPRCLTVTLSSLWDVKLSAGCEGRTALANRTCSLEPLRCSEWWIGTFACSVSFTACDAFTGTWRGARRTKKGTTVGCHHWDSFFMAHLGILFSFFFKWWDVFFPSVFEALTPTIWGTFHLGWFSGKDCFICSYVYKYIIYLKFYCGTSWALKVFNLPSQTWAFCSPRRLILICLRAETLRAPPQKHFLHFLGRSFFFFFFGPWALSKVSPCKLCEKRYRREQEPLRITSTPSAQPSPRPSLWGWG